MKSKVYTIILILIGFMQSTAQVDRTKAPEPGPAPKIQLKDPKTFDLDNGIKVFVVEDHKLPRVTYVLRIDNKPITEGDKAGLSSIFSDVMGNGTTNISKEKFLEEIDFLGGSLSIGAQSAFAGGLSRYSKRFLELMADAVINPLLTEEEFQKAKDRAIESFKVDEKSVENIAGRISSALSFGTHHPYGEFATEETLNNVKFEDVKDFYGSYYSPNNAYLVVIGDVDFSEVKKDIKNTFGNWKKSNTKEYDLPAPSENVNSTEIDFVDMPNAVQSNIILTNNVSLQMNDDDYFAALIANFILGGGGTGYLFQNLREDKGYTYGAYSSIGASRYKAARFTATAEVRNNVTDSSIVEMLKEIKRLQNEPVSKNDLENAKAQYSGGFIQALENPQTPANFALNIELNNLDDDFYSDYLAKIKAVTAEDVQNAAKKYFKHDNARIIVVGKGSEVVPGIESLSIPVNYYDKYANKVDKPSFNKAIPAGLTAEKVLETYIEKIGGKEELSKINTVLEKANVSIANVPVTLSADIKVMSPNKESIEMSAEGMGVIMKQKFDGKSGYTEQQGQKIPLPEEAVKVKLKEKAIFPEMHYLPNEVKLESIVPVDGKDAYKVSVNLDGQVSYRYYNVSSGLLVQTQSTFINNGQELQTITNYGDYRDVEGILFPFELKVQSGPQNITFNLNSVKFNEGVFEEDFK